MINDDYNHDVSGEYKHCVCRFHTLKQINLSGGK